MTFDILRAQSAVLVSSSISFISAFDCRKSEAAILPRCCRPCTAYSSSGSSAWCYMDCKLSVVTKVFHSTDHAPIDGSLGGKATGARRSQVITYHGSPREHQNSRTSRASGESHIRTRISIESKSCESYIMCAELGEGTHAEMFRRHSADTLY